MIHVQRPVVLTGIEEFVRRADLGDRSVYLDLPRIDPANRRREDEYWPAFYRDQPTILGGLLDAVAGGLRLCPRSSSPNFRAWRTSPPSARLSVKHSDGRPERFSPATTRTAAKGRRTSSKTRSWQTSCSETRTGSTAGRAHLPNCCPSSPGE